MSTILQEAYLTGDKVGLKRYHIAAAVFELAEQGALSICVNRDGTVVLSRRSQPVNTLSHDQASLHSKLFWGKETITLQPSQRGALTHVSLAGFNRLVDTMLQGKMQRLIQTFHWRMLISLLGMASGLTLLVASLLQNVGLLLVGGISLLATTFLTSYAYLAKEHSLSSPNGLTPLNKESGVSFLVWVHGPSRQGVTQAIGDWINDPQIKRRRPTWWTTPGDWPNGHETKFARAFTAISGAVVD